MGERVLALAVWMVVRGPGPHDAHGAERRIALLSLVRESPGLPGAEIRRRLLLAHGSFDHHVRHLKSDGLLVSVEAGNQLTYYLPSQLKGERAQPRHTDAVVEAFLRDHPAASSQQIAAGCGIPQSTVESHLRGLERAGRVLRAKQGRRYVF